MSTKNIYCKDYIKPDILANSSKAKQSNLSTPVFMLNNLKNENTMR